MECVTKLKNRYDKLIDEYDALQREADEYNMDDMDKANDKLKLLRAKVDQYEIKLTDAQMIDVLAKHANLIESDENKALAEKKV